MYHMLLWNSISPRKRSPSDTFLENGIGILLRNCEDAGFNVIVEDWASIDFYNHLSPEILSRINRLMYKNIINNEHRKFPVFYDKILPFMTLITQKILDTFHNVKMNKYLNKLAKEIANKKIPLLGVKVWYGDGFKWSRKLVKKVNKYSPETITIAGGPHPTIYSEDFLQYSNFDLAVVSEGESTIIDILSVVKKYKKKSEILSEIGKAAEKNNISNLIYRDNNSIKKTERKKLEINGKKIPEYTNKENKAKIHVIIDSLGCPYGQCNFCVHSKFYEYKSRSPELVVEEIKSMLKNGIGLFRFAGSSPPFEHILKISEIILKEKLKIKYSMFGMARSGSKEQHIFYKLVETYQTLIKAGLRAIFFGAESGNDFINQEALNKIRSKEDLIYTIRALRKASELVGIYVDVGISFIYPVPTMGKINLKQIYNENLQLASEIDADSVLCCPPGPFPQTNWFNESAKYGFKIGKDFVPNFMEYEYVLYKPIKMWSNIDMSLDNLNGKELLEECGKMRKGFKNIGFPTEITDEHFLLLRNAGYEGKEGVKKFKKETLLDLLSCNYNFTNKIYEKVNQVSNLIAESNFN